MKPWVGAIQEAVSAKVDASPTRTPLFPDGLARQDIAPCIYQSRNDRCASPQAH